MAKLHNIVLPRILNSTVTEFANNVICGVVLIPIKALIIILTLALLNVLQWNIALLLIIDYHIKRLVGFHGQKD